MLYPDEFSDKESPYITQINIGIFCLFIRKILQFINLEL